ncbi:MAG: MFS transporter [Symbiobacteriia bacterium]
MRSILRNRALLSLALAESVSTIGDWIAGISIYALLVFRGDGSVAETSGVLIASLVPILLLSPVAGWLMDRYDRKLLLIGSELLSAVAIGGLLLVEPTHLASLYALLAAQAAVGSVMLPGRRAILPGIVAESELTRVNAFLQQLSGLVKAGAPVLAGGLLAAMSPRQALLLDVVSFLGSAAILCTLPAFPPPTAVRDGAAADRSAELPSLAAVFRSVPLLAVMLPAQFLLAFVLISFDAVSPTLVRDALHGGEALFGIIVGLIGLGTILGATGLMLRRKASDPWRDMLAGTALLAFIPAAAAAVLYLEAQLQAPALTRTVFAAGCLVGGLGQGIALVQASTLLQQLSPPTALGRTAGAFQSALVAGQLAGIVATPLLVPAVLSLEQYLWLSVGVLAIMVTLTAVGVRRYRLANQVLPKRGRELHAID